MGEQELKEVYEHIIIGGGINGAGIFRDISLHHEEVLLLEKETFASQTSSRSSKMLHGGIRYLETFDFGLVYEALKEKNFWKKRLPSIAREQHFFLPVYKDSKWPLFLLRLGLFLYDLLSLFRNRPHKVYNARLTQKSVPLLRGQGLTGSGLYYDVVVDDAKLTKMNIEDALRQNPQGSLALEHAQVTHIERDASTSHFLLTILLGSGQPKEVKISAKNLIIAAGPFTDQLLKNTPCKWKPQLLLSKGSHIWISKDKLPLEDSIVMQTKDDRIIFVIPQGDQVLLGTTEVTLPEDADMFNIQADQEEIDYILKNTNHYFPSLNLTSDDIHSTFSGVRPLIREKSMFNPHKTSRKHKVYTPSPHLYVILGGKLTTFRTMSQSLCKKLFKDNRRPYDKKKTLAPLLVKDEE